MRGLGVARMGVCALGMALGFPTAAGAVPDCVGQGTPRTLLAERGNLESVFVERRGALFYTETGRNALMRLDRPGAHPAVHDDGIVSPGGIVADGAGGLLVGTGTSIPEAALANLPGPGRAGLYRVAPRRPGAKQLVATGLTMANGLARGPDGAVYASSDVAIRGIDRIRFGAGGAIVEKGWAPVLSANGIAVDRAGRFLYAAQTFVPAAIARVDLASGAVSTFTRPPLTDLAAGLDGMAIDPRDRLYVAANSGNAAWFVQTDGRACALARGIGRASAVALGVQPPRSRAARRARRKPPFPPTSLYVVAFSGVLVEIPNATRARVP